MLKMPLKIKRENEFLSLYFFFLKIKRENKFISFFKI